MSPKSLLVIVLFHAAATPALAQIADPWRGETVRLRDDGIRAGMLRHGLFYRSDTSLDANKEWKVNRSERGLLQLEGGGWVTRADVVRAREAKGYFDRMIATQPDQAKWLARRGTLGCRTMYFMNTVGGHPLPLQTEGSQPESRADFLKAVRLEPRCALWRVYLAVSYIASSDWVAATDQLDEVSRFSPKEPLAFQYRGFIHTMRNNYEQAVSEFDRALELDPTAQIYLSRAVCLLACSKLSQAMIDLEFAVQLAPTDEEVLLNVARIKWQFGARASAVTELDRLVEANPLSVDAVVSRAWYRKELGRYLQAWEDLQRLTALRPTDPSTYRAQGWILAAALDENMRDGKRALEFARVATRLGGEVAGSEDCELFAAAYAELGRFEQAIELQQKIVTLVKASSGSDEQRLAAEMRLECYKRKRAYRD